MPCFWPLPAWQHRDNLAVVLRDPARTPEQSAAASNYNYLRLPCGGCIGCRASRAREWAMRCGLELQSHDHACWTTLTYDDEHLPSTLAKAHLSGWVKRLRRVVEPVRVRFFASGEYGERSLRPHYHAILFGLPITTAGKIQDTWPYGFTRTDSLSAASIAYVAGYCSKKVGYKLESGERLDPDTGELYDYQAPFVLMSRNPGIASDARKYWQSWRLSALYHSAEIPVPRFLHASWLSHASPSQVSLLSQEKASLSLLKDTSQARLLAGEQIASAKLSLSSQRRTTL